MVCRLLKSLESGRLTEDGGQLSMDGIVYLSDIANFGIFVNLESIYFEECLINKNVSR